MKIILILVTCLFLAGCKEKEAPAFNPVPIKSETTNPPLTRQIVTSAPIVTLKFEYKLLPPDAFLITKICNQGTPYAVNIYAYSFPWQYPKGQGSYGLMDTATDLWWYLGKSEWLKITDVNPWQEQVRQELIQLKAEGKYTPEGEVYPLPTQPPPSNGDQP